MPLIHKKMFHINAIITATIIVIISVNASLLNELQLNFVIAPSKGPEKLHFVQQ